MDIKSFVSNPGLTLKVERVKRNIKQRDMAKALGLTPQMLGHIEKSEDLSKALNVDRALKLLEFFEKFDNGELNFND